MTFPGWLAALIMFLQLPIPLYWFVMHPGVAFWRRHRRAGYITGLCCSWLPVTAGLIWFRADLFRRDWPGWARAGAGLVLIIFEGWVFWRVHRDLGGARLVGAMELSGGGEITHAGIYGYVRHPRYGASFLAITGGCLIGGTKTLWVVAGVWLALMMVAILLEEREMRGRFGAAYERYCERVPGRFLPQRLKIRN